MSSKPLIIVGLAVALAAVSGAALSANNTAAHPRGADSDPTGVVAQSDNGGGSDKDIAPVGASAGETEAYVEETSADVTQEAIAASESSTEGGSVISDVDSNSGNSVNVSAEFKVIRVTDRKTDVEKSPRVLFGIYASDCYLKMYSDCTAELYINPSSGKSITGTYSIYGDTMYVDYGGGDMTEYKVVFSDNNEIENIIVPSSNYDIYFG